MLRIHSVVNLERFSFRALSTELTKICCCYSRQASSFGVMKICITSRRRKDVMNTFISYNKCSKCFPPAFVYSLNLFHKLGTALLIGPAENCPISSSVQLLIQKLLLASDEAFKMVRRSPDMISLRIPICSEPGEGDHCSFSVNCSWEAEINKQLCKTLTLRIRHTDVIVKSRWS